MIFKLEHQGLELKAFLAIWYVLAVLLPDLMGFALRDWRAAVVGACISAVMIVLPFRILHLMTQEALTLSE